MADILSNAWSPVSTGNVSTPPDGLPTGTAPNKLAPTIREIMAAIRRQTERSNAILTSTGASNAYVLTYTGAPDTLRRGEIYVFWANHTNTGAATLNINGLGAKAIMEPDGTAVLAGQIVNGTTVAVVYDGTNFRMLTVPQSNPSFNGVLSTNGSILVSSNGSTLAIQRNGTGAIDIEAFLSTNSATKHAIDLNRYGGAVTINGYTAWHAGNDGAGSGSDMDLLDGQHGSFYQNANNLNAGTIADARLPTSMAGKTFTSQIGATSYQINGAAGTNLITAGPGDNATWATHNIKFQGWYGMGMYDHAGNVNGMYNFREGSWEVKGGFKINGQNVWSPWNFDPNTKLNTSGNQTMSGTLTVSDFISNANVTAMGANMYIRSSGNRHLWFNTNTGTARGLVYHDNSGSLNLQLYNTSGTFVRRATFSEGGEFYVQGSLKSDGNVVVGNATYQTDGNIYMPWAGDYLSNVLGSKITSEGRSYPRRIGGVDLNFHWSGQGGQPSWLWGGNDGTNMYVYNPSNFNVNWANGAGNADTVDGYHAGSFAQFHTGGGTEDTNMPIGSIVHAYTTVLVARNQATAVYLYSGDNLSYTINTAPGAQLAGTWRSRGGFTYSGSNRMQVLQRTA